VTARYTPQHRARWCWTAATTWFAAVPPPLNWRLNPDPVQVLKSPASIPCCCCYIKSGLLSAAFETPASIRNTLTPTDTRSCYWMLPSKADMQQVCLCVAWPPPKRRRTTTHRHSCCASAICLSPPQQQQCIHPPAATTPLYLAPPPSRALMSHTAKAPCHHNHSHRWNQTVLLLDATRRPSYAPGVVRQDGLAANRLLTLLRHTAAAHQLFA